jgi:hypothetical protein
MEDMPKKLLLMAFGRAILTGLAFQINPFSPISSILRKAIRMAKRAENKKGAG